LRREDRGKESRNASTREESHHAAAVYP
jgi:hypothetical protein